MKTSLGYHRIAFLISGLWLALSGGMLTGCASTAPQVTEATTSGAMQPVWAGAIRVEPVIRVRILTSVTTLTVSSPTGRVQLQGAGQGAGLQVFPSPLTITGKPGQWVLTSSQGSTYRRSDAWLDLDSLSSQGQPQYQRMLQVNGSPYPHGLRVQAVSKSHALGGFDVINVLPMEAYLPGVLDKELYPGWHPEAYRAQAIAARSYALAQLAQTANKPFDLEATVASQAYRGMVTNAKALAAVRDTRGAVLTWRGQVFPAYYSSACGGAGQDASVAFPLVGNTINIPPLQGHPHGACCGASPHYRWGPVSVERLVLAQRLAAWGRANRHPIAGMQGLADVAVNQVNQAQRPGGFRITDMQGRSYLLGPEQFRFACNHDAGGMKASAGAQLVKSSLVQVRLTGNLVVFSGQGLGHGVGLCQWGAQGLAQAGHSHMAILNFYYRDSVILKVY